MVAPWDGRLPRVGDQVDFLDEDIDLEGKPAAIWRRAVVVGVVSPPHSAVKLQMIPGERSPAENEWMIEKDVEVAEGTERFALLGTHTGGRSDSSVTGVPGENGHPGMGRAPPGTLPQLDNAPGPVGHTSGTSGDIRRNPEHNAGGTAGRAPARTSNAGGAMGKFRRGFMKIILAQQESVAGGLWESGDTAPYSSVGGQDGSETERQVEAPSGQGEGWNESRSQNQSGVRSRGPSDVAPAGTIYEERQEPGIGEVRAAFAGEGEGEGEEESKESESPESAVLSTDVLARSRQGSETPAQLSPLNAESSVGTRSPARSSSTTPAKAGFLRDVVAGNAISTSSTSPARGTSNARDRSTSVSEDSAPGSGVGAKPRGAAALQSRRGRELTPHAIAEIDGKFQLTVFRLNKQDDKRQIPVSFTIGTYETEVEALRAAEAHSSPVWETYEPSSTCFLCGAGFNMISRRKHHCKNCGRLVCKQCSGCFWPVGMLPETYRVDSKERFVRVCDSCCEAKTKFREALLSASEEEAKVAFDTGCINLRVPYMTHSQERPVHCAASGGNLELLRWLVEDRHCPVRDEKDEPLEDKDGRSVMSAAAASYQATAMRYLASNVGCDASSIKTLPDIQRGLQACLMEGEELAGALDAHYPPPQRNCYRRPYDEYESAIGTFETGFTPYHLSEEPLHLGTGANLGDSACLVCWRKRADCTLVPCGHLCVCFSCAHKFSHCPVCHQPVTRRIKITRV